MRSPYSSAAIRRGVRASDSRDFGIDLKKDRVQLVEDAVEHAAEDPSPLAQSQTLDVRGKVCHYYPLYSTNLVLRATARYLSQRFRITAPNRDRVIRSVIDAMSDGSPFHVIRRDITSFYENIPTEDLRHRLLFDTAIPKQVRRHLRAYFEIAPDTERGLPRGIGLTTILAELAMHSFDQAVRSIPGVYRYFRYSDDILVFCTGDVTATQQAIESALPGQMTFNRKKCGSASFLPTGQVGETDGFDYLGYHIRAEKAAPKKGKPRVCDVSVSPIKIRKLKTRIVLSLKKFRSTSPTLLLYRMRYLSGNYRVNRIPGYYELTSNFTRSGIYFNYKRCGRHTGPKHVETERQELMAVDWFYHHLIESPKSVYSGILPTLPPALAARLRAISFQRGHALKLQARVPVGIVGQVTSAWRDH